MRGPRVAMGYWRDRALTARAFGVDTDGTRFWRSGDLVRPDDEGLLHFVGRRDNVVKINGKLVEPSEPERVLGSIPGVRRGVVLVQPAPRGGSRLVAHLEVDDTGAPTPAEVRTAVVDRVAAHLVPAVLVRHDHLPLTERGKVDFPIARAIMAMFGEDMYLKKYLKALAAKFGQTATFSND